MKPVSVVGMENRVREVAARVAATSGLELILVELVRGGSRGLVRLTIDREGGVTLDDCASFSRRVGAELEVEDPIPGSYSLEVSSPGLDRRLVKEADYERFRGQHARISLGSPLEGRRHFQGILLGVEDGQILLEMEGGERARFPLSSVDKARLVPQF